MGMGKEWIVYIVELVKFWLMELDMLIRSALSDAQWLIAKGGTDRAEVLNRVLRNIDYALKELNGADLIDLNKVWHQVKDVMPTSAYGGNHGDLLCVHQFKPNSHPHIVNQEELIVRSDNGTEELISCRVIKILNEVNN